MGGQRIELPQTEKARAALEIKARYTSVSHRTMQELQWTASPHTNPPCRSSRPDMVTQRVPLYESKAHAWQCLGPAFDRASPRRQFTSPRPVNYISEYRQNKHTPGYTGEIALVQGDKGRADLPLIMRTNVRRTLPPPTSVSTRPNVVGYTGCVYHSDIHPAHSISPPATTTHKVHRVYPVNEHPTTYGKPSPISRQVTLTHPYNPAIKTRG